jgi:hypothetical protein
MGGIIRGDVVDSTDVYVPPAKTPEQLKAEEEQRKREAEAKKAGN